MSIINLNAAFSLTVYMPLFVFVEYSDFQLHAGSAGTAAVVGSGSGACRIDVLVNVKQSKYDQR